MSEPLFDRFLTDHLMIWIFSTQKSNLRVSEVLFLRSNWIFRRTEPCVMSSYLNIEPIQDHWMLHNDCDKYELKIKIIIGMIIARRAKIGQISYIFRYSGNHFCLCSSRSPLIQLLPPTVSSLKCLVKTREWEPLFLYFKLTDNMP